MGKIYWENIEKALGIQFRQPRRTFCESRNFRTSNATKMMIRLIVRNKLPSISISSHFKLLFRLYLLPFIIYTLAMAEKGKFELIEGYELEPEQLFRQEGIEAILSRIEHYQASNLPKVFEQSAKRLEDTVTALINQRFSALQYMITQLQSRLDQLNLEPRRDDDTYSLKRQKSEFERRSESQFEGGLISRREDSDEGDRSVINIDRTSYM